MLAYISEFFVVIFSSVIACFQKKCSNNVEFGEQQRSSNPDLFSNPLDILKRNKIKYERYSVTTKDGYILGVFRIPTKNPKGVVILQHPLDYDFTVWLDSFGGLAFSFHQRGYDVWMPNTRGTPFSMEHVNMTPLDFEYWDFSFHEIGVYDHSAVVQFIKNKTNNSSITFISHSMSTTSSLIYAAMNPEEAKNSIKVFIQMGPVSYLRHPGSYWLCRFVVALIDIFMLPIFRLFRKGALFTGELTRALLLRAIVYFPFKKLIIYNLCCFYGWSPDEVDPILFDYFMSHTFKSFPTKILVHYAQWLKGDGVFRMFDYGKKKNVEIYNNEIPPEYALDKIQTPVYFMTGELDKFSKDVDEAYSKLPPAARRHGQLKIPAFGHMDFLYGRRRAAAVHGEIFDLLGRIDGRRDPRRP